MTAATPAGATPGTVDAVADVVRGYLAQEMKVEPATIADDEVLKNIPGVDSVHLLRVVSRLERHWDVEFDDEQIFASVTLTDLVTLVTSYVRAKD
ncbi:acyl carrier protein [Winogradskya humida]|uniref:Carrier domain-containing protein n=1 Tax=Winogradskya humida TaxID=113566 RepID=A0ABQ4A5L2_9ACTN|nr:acyl carrier protein [Actinoplanes humidus]GIE26155.1 hypothetical protein Ahu01nite_092570 [Actinoplanes humidus]